MIKLKYYGGNGFHTCRVPGNYRVVSDELDIQFTDLNEAKEYYKSLKGEKAFWDVTVCPQLIDAYFYSLQVEK